MKFNEKLINLRKKAGLSQEELGYKLNVTRQTVSKWELGQTTPEMDKLIEISKIFNISVDELINESETKNDSNSNPIIEDQPIEKTNNKEKTVRTIVIGVLIVVILLIVIGVFTGSSILNIFNKTAKTEEGIIDKFFSMFDKTIEKQENSMNTEGVDNNSNIFNEAKNIIDGTDKKMEISQFNGPIKIYNGTQMGVGVKSVLDTVITSNKTKENKIKVKFMEIETENVDEIKNLKQNIDKYTDYEVEEIFYFNNKKCRIYTAFGVSQTPKINMYRKGEIYDNINYNSCFISNYIKII